MKKFFVFIKNLLLDILFPKFCIGCGKEGSYLCKDCLSLIEIIEYQFCPVCGKRIINGKICETCKKKTNLNGLYFAVSYQNQLVKKLITQFKYKPFIKQLSPILSFLIITHLSALNKTDFSEFSLIPVPLSKKRLKWRGFNQSKEIAKELSKYLKIPVLDNTLFRKKETVPQTKLKKEQRKENIKQVFLCDKQKLKENKKILLIDDVYTTGATMEECAKVLKQAGVKEVRGIVIARE